ncbi:hypothetical protein GCM10009627_15580 [Curtobacterium herbarum]|uniref:Secreted protein n=1 Tax=Curtobacterium herbarum TaxID=150122 RepID=A0ABN1ZEW0_9MICO
MFAWGMPSITFVLIAGHLLACVLAYMHTAPINAAHRATDESGRGFSPGRATGRDERLPDHSLAISDACDLRRHNRSRQYVCPSDPTYVHLAVLPLYVDAVRSQSEDTTSLVE